MRGGVRREDTPATRGRCVSMPTTAELPLIDGPGGQRERAALGVAAHSPPVAGWTTQPSELANPLQRRGQVGSRRKRRGSDAVSPGPGPRSWTPRRRPSSSPAQPPGPRLGGPSGPARRRAPRARTGARGRRRRPGIRSVALAWTENPRPGCHRCRDSPTPACVSRRQADLTRAASPSSGRTPRRRSRPSPSAR